MELGRADIDEDLLLAGTVLHRTWIVLVSLWVKTITMDSTWLSAWVWTYGALVA